MRCNDCNKFVSLDKSNEPEGQDESDTIGEDGDAECSVRIVDKCEECGAELREYTEEFTFDFSNGEYTKHLPKDEDEETNPDTSEHYIEIEFEYARDEKTVDRVVHGTSKKTGKPTKRTVKEKVYVVTATCHLNCKCGWTDSDTNEAEVNPSDMDECC